MKIYTDQYPWRLFFEFSSLDYQNVVIISMIFVGIILGYSLKKYNVIARLKTKLGELYS